MLTRGREAQARSLPDTVLSPLPRGFVRFVFLLLPVDTRLRCSEVSRAWRALLADKSFWACLEVATPSGLSGFSMPLFRAAVAKAGGRLRALAVTVQYPFHNFQLFDDAVTQTVRSNSATLTDLRMDTPFMSTERMRVLLDAVPALQFFDVSAVCLQDRQVARAMLRNEPPFQALLLRRLHLSVGLDDPNAVTLSRVA